MSMVGNAPIDVNAAPAEAVAAPGATEAATAATATTTTKDVGVELELDAINRNPSMAMVLRVLDRLHTEVAPPQPKAGGGTPDMPLWMAEMQAVFSSATTHLNAKLFIAKVRVEHHGPSERARRRRRAG